MNDLPVYEILRSAARDWPENPAVYDEHGVMSFGELFKEAEEMRLQLMRLGIKEGMGIGVMAANGRHVIIGILQRLAAGLL